MFSEVLLKVLGVFFLVLLGVVAGKTKVVTEKTLPAINGMVFNFIIPCLMISVMQMDDVGAQQLRNLAESCILFAAVTIIMGLVSFLLVKPFKLSPSDEGIFRYQVAFTNSGFMGIPLVAAIFGPVVRFPVVVMCAVFSIVCYSFGIFVICHEKGSGGFDKSMLKNMINPPIIFALVGVMLFLLDIQLPDWLMSNVDLMADSVSPVAMFIVGVNLSRSNVLKLLRPKNLGLCFVSLILTPLLVLMMCRLAPVGNVALIAVTIAMAMPSPSIAPVLADKYGKDSVWAAEGVAITTFLSLFTLPVWAWILLNYFPY